MIERYLLENEKRDLREVQSQEIVFAGVNQAFYYVMNPNGEIIMGDNQDKRLQLALTPLLNSRVAKKEDVFYETIHMDDIRKERGKQREFRPDIEQDIRLIIAGHPIIYKGQIIGTLYIGRDFTFATQVFQWVLIILVVLGIIFIGFAIFISQRMSKKAMVPISNAFTRQKEFVADASHELRTPLAVLHSSIDAMEMTIEPEKDDFTGKLLTNMKQEVKRMTNLISDLLTLARSDSNILELRKEVFDFRQVAERVIESLSSLANKKEISIRLDAPNELLAIGDPERLSQLIYILLDNAIKYTPTDGKVKLTLSQEESGLSIAMQDTGIGISSEDLHHIFERFYRADKSRSRQMGGHGLGLSIAKWIVDTHKGNIEVVSTPGEGTIFLINIPQQ
ncbi:cell wall metabolism sensor histidine kinase WalK [Lysinibacillus sp. BW-2-10]|uniref:sensor histidine kinase n=1 Tax=Lysinibacillus sp. BW-2-10 TaxID=2590030 RepID=UPI002107BB93|nr:ATP-binding protein [Lysinibacillus sp. BW-2-10]